MREASLQKWTLGRQCYQVMTDCLIKGRENFKLELEFKLFQPLFQFFNSLPNMYKCNRSKKIFMLV